MKKEVWDSIKNLGTFLNDLDKRLNKLEKEVESIYLLLRSTEKRVIDLEAKTKKL